MEEFVFKPFNDEETKAFETLKRILSSEPVLALPQAGLPYVLDTDACDVQIGAVLNQDHKDEKGKSVYHPLGYYSRVLNETERKYATTHKECFAIVWALLLLRAYLEGVRFLLRTDHAALKWILTTSDATGK